MVKCSRLGLAHPLLNYRGVKNGELTKEQRSQMDKIEQLEFVL